MGQTSGQVDGDLRWFLLDSTDPDYAATRAALENMAALYGGTYVLTAGNIANTQVVATKAPQSAIDAATPSLVIGAAAVLDEMNYSVCVNPNADEVSIYTSIWGDKFPVWGEFLEQPQALPTSSVDQLVEHWKSGGKAVCYVSQNGSGDLSGSNYQNAARVKDIIHTTRGSATVDTSVKDIIVFCGRVSRFRNEGTGANDTGFWLKSGTSLAHTIVMAHPVDGGDLMGSPKIASGANGESADFTSIGSDTWYSTFTSGMFDTAIGSMLGHFVLSDDSGDVACLESAETLADCIATNDSYFAPRMRRGQWNATTTYAAGDAILWRGVVFYALQAHSNQQPPETDYSKLGLPNASAYWAQIFLVQGAWSGAANYVVGDQVSSAGTTYVCVQAHTNQTPPNATYWAVITVTTSSSSTLGTWNSTATYPVGACVTSGGTIYTCVTSNTNDLPPSANWVATTTNERVYVHLASGNNPKATTYFGTASAAAGIRPLTRSQEYIDFVGLGFYQTIFAGTNHRRFNRIRWIGCRILYAGTCTSMWNCQYGGSLNYDVGLFRETGTTYTFSEPEANDGREILGCEIGFAGAGLYDNVNHSAVPTNTVFRDNYCHDIGVIHKGHNIGNNDSHTFASFGGFDGATVRNNKQRRCAWNTFVFYALDTGHTQFAATTITDGAVTNGTFAADTNWTKTGTAAIAGGVASLASGDTIEQAITISAPYVNATRKHALHFDLGTAASINIAVGTTPGGSEILAATTITLDPTVTHGAVAFVPTATTFYIRFIATATCTLDNVRLPTSLASEDGFVRGIPAAGRYQNIVGTSEACMILNRNISVTKNWFLDPVKGGFKKTGYQQNHVQANEGQYVSFNGDINYGLGGQIEAVECVGNVIFGVGTQVSTDTERGFRLKWLLPSPYTPSELSFRDNMTRNVYNSFRHVATGGIDENGNVPDGTWELTGSDFHSTFRHIIIDVTSHPTRRKINSDNNKFRNDEGGNWNFGGAIKITLADWTAAIGANDTALDGNSTDGALTTDTGSPAIAVSGTGYLGATLTASVGVDPDGATSDLDYQYKRNGAFISGATASTYAATIANGNAASDAITCTVLGHDAEGKWFRETSNTVTLLAANDVFLYTNADLGESDPSNNVVLFTQQEREDGFPPAAAGDEQAKMKIGISLGIGLSL